LFKIAELFCRKKVYVPSPVEVLASHIISTSCTSDLNSVAFRFKVRMTVEKFLDHQFTIKTSANHKSQSSPALRSLHLTSPSVARARDLYSSSEHISARSPLLFMSPFYSSLSQEGNCLFSSSSLPSSSSETAILPVSASAPLPVVSAEEVESPSFSPSSSLEDSPPDYQFHLVAHMKNQSNYFNES